MIDYCKKEKCVFYRVGGTFCKKDAPKLGYMSKTELKCLDFIDIEYKDNVKEGLLTDKENIKPVSSFKAITTEMAELYEIKNKNYGNSFSEQYKDYGMTSVCIRLDDKIRRLKSLNRQGTNGTNDESLRDTLIDLANYSVLAIMELDNKGE